MHESLGACRKDFSMRVFFISDIIHSKNMKIMSPAFEHMGKIPSKYTCDGQDINPPLKFEEVPQDAKSLVLIVDDPDAPVGLWVHWLVWDIDPSVAEIRESSVPQGAVQGLTNFGDSCYGGPCPPDREHRYFFSLYALDCLLGLDKNSQKDDLEKVMHLHVIDQAELIGLYERI